MKLVALDIPDETAALAGWLEQRLTGLDLGALVAELDAVHGPGTASSESLDTLLGNRRGRVLREGLRAIGPEDLQRLLRQPRLLLDLQELVLTEGGDHWQTLGAGMPETRVRAERGWARLEPLLREQQTAARPDPSVLPRNRPGRWFARPWFVSLATAASLLALVAGYQRLRGPVVVAQAGWGWNRPGALPQDLPRSAYLTRLADDAEEWFRKRPDEPVALARRISEFRQGCSVLILAEHRPLPAEDRAWLVGKCKAWAAKLDAHLAAVEAGEDPIQVRDEADATIHKLIAALRERVAA